MKGQYLVVVFLRLESIVGENWKYSWMGHNPMLPLIKISLVGLNIKHITLHHCDSASIQDMQRREELQL